METFEFPKPIILSLIITPLALISAILSAGAGHGSYFLAKILFPYTMLSTSLFESITTPFILLAIVQFPLYGLILAFVSVGKGIKIGLSIILLAILHILAVGLCFIFVSSNFS